MHDLIPPDRRDAVALALGQTFGAAEFDHTPVQMAGGMSGAALFRVRVGGIAYILRLEGAQPPPFGDTRRAHACMRSAANACLAPRVRYANADTGVVIMDLVPEQPLANYAGDRADLIVELAQAVRVLHQTPAFPAVVDYLAGMDHLTGWFEGAGLASSESRELFARFVAFRDQYRTPAADLVSSHNDLNARNVLYDGRRLWLIDWDSAFLADRYVDLAAVANWFCRDEAETDLLLATYFQAPATDARRARLSVMRQVNHLFYGVMFALSGLEAGAALDVAAARPLTDQRADLIAGRLDLWQAPNRLAYGASLLAEALKGFRSADFAERLTLAA